MNWTFNNKETIEQTTITTYDLTLTPIGKLDSTGVTFYLEKRENLPNETDYPQSYAEIGVYTLTGSKRLIEIIDFRNEATLPTITELNTKALPAIQGYLVRVLAQLTSHIAELTKK